MKYSLQCRLGMMGGVMMAYHNTQEMFGFEYIPLSKMEETLFHSTPCAEKAFDSSMKLYQFVLNRLVKDFEDEKCLRVTLWAHRTTRRRHLMDIFVEAPLRKLDPAKGALSDPYIAPFGVDSLSLDQLRAECKLRNLETFGNPAMLVSRLEEYLANSAPTPPELSNAYLEDMVKTGRLVHYVLRVENFDSRGRPIFGPIEYDDKNEVMDTVYSFAQAEPDPKQVVSDFLRASRVVHRTPPTSQHMQSMINLQFPPQKKTHTKFQQAPKTTFDDLVRQAKHKPVTFEHPLAKFLSSK